MTQTSSITAELRDRAGKGAARATRRAGKVPGVIYGDKQSPTLIALNPRLLYVEMRKKGFHTRLFDIDLGDGRSERALVRDVQMHPVTDAPVHVDFQRIGPDTIIHVAVPVHFLNHDKSPGLKRGGVLNVVRHDIDLVCTAENMPEIIEIDLTGLEIGDSVHISKVVLPAGVKPSIDRDFTVASVAAPTVVRAGDGG